MCLYLLIMYDNALDNSIYFKFYFNDHFKPQKHFLKVMPHTIYFIIMEERFCDQAIAAIISIAQTI